MTDAFAVRELTTPVGTARAHLSVPPGPRGLLVLGHGAGGGIDAPDLLAAAAGGRSAGLAVALVEQPWRVSGRRVAEAPARLDRAWAAAVPLLHAGIGGVLVLGGRSAGARVACRTAGGLGAAAVLALAFPLVSRSGRSRDAELRTPSVPRLVVQGERDAFGVPAPSAGVVVRVVPGADHAFGVRRRDGRTAREVAEQVEGEVAGWLAQVLT